MSDIKVGWYIRTDNSVGGGIVYTPGIARDICESGRWGNVLSVHKVATEWSGSHDKGDRSFREVSRVDVTEEFV